MSSATIHLPSSRGHRFEPLRRVPRGVWILLAILLSWGVEIGIYQAFEPPGQVLRHELLGAAGELGGQWLEPTPTLNQAIRRHFAEGSVTVDTGRQWPNVAVSLLGVPRQACVQAMHEARRIDGPVVIVLDRYRFPSECGERNDMTWWLMP